VTEAEWLASEDPEGPLLYLTDSAVSNRKLSLFGCACVRRVWGALADDRLRRALEVAERFADGLATPRQLASARKAAQKLCKGIGDIIADHGPMAVGAVCGQGVSVFTVAESTGAVAAEAWSDEGVSWDTAHAQERRAQAALLRDIFGNPFMPVVVAEAWLTPAITRLAQAAYDARRLPEGSLDPSGLAVLADVFEEGGCAEEEILGHLRQPGQVHVCGCWCLDLILKKE
jgi:hypothetical protein